MKPEAIDAILATNPRYAGASFHKPETDGAFIPMPNRGMVRIQQDAKLNAAKAILAEQLAGSLIDFLAITRPWISDDAIEKAEAALTAWREVCSAT